MTSEPDVTRILKGWNTNRASVLEELTPIVYGELRKIAAAQLRGQRANHTLQPTALINEAYLRLVRQASASFEDRSHFYATAALIMRQILVDAARAHYAEKRGSGKIVQAESELELGVEDHAMNLLVIHDALEKLALQSERAARALELRYFGGLQLEEAAEALDVSIATLKRDLALGQAYLRRALAGPRK